MSSFIESETERVVTVLDLCVAQLRDIAIVPLTKQLPKFIVSGAAPTDSGSTGDQDDSPHYSPLETALLKQAESEITFAKSFGQGKGGLALPELFATTRRLSRDIAAARQLREVGEIGSQSVDGKVLSMIERSSDRRRARGAGASTAAGSGMVPPGTARSTATHGTSRPFTAASTTSKGTGVTGGGGGGLLPLEGLAEALSQLRVRSQNDDSVETTLLQDLRRSCVQIVTDAMHARFMTSVEQKALLEDFERGLDDKIRQAEAHEQLLVEELRRQRQKREADRTKQDDEEARFRAEYDDADTRSRQAAQALASSEAEQHRSLRSSHESHSEAIDRDLQQTEQAVAQKQAGNLAAAEGLRKKRFQETVRITEILGEYDARMAEMQAEDDLLAAENRRIERQIAALRQHFDVEDANEGETKHEDGTVGAAIRQEFDDRERQELNASLVIAEWARRRLDQKAAELAAKKGKRKGKKGKKKKKK